MPGYSTVKDTIFTGRTGRELRHHPPEVRELQFWLTCGPDRDPFGIFIFEPETVAPRIGRTTESLRASLGTLVALQFCEWDAASQFVWVIEMAHHQFQTPLKAVDNRCATARKWYAGAPESPWLGPWFDRYVFDFHLEKDPHAVERRGPRQAPPKGLGEGLGEGLTKPLVLSDLPAPIDLSQKEIFVPPSVELATPAPDRDRPLRGAELEDAFMRLWRAYPKAVELRKCQAAFAKARPTHALVAEMLAAVDTQKRSEGWLKGYIPKLVTWIENQRWLDRVEDQPAPLTERHTTTLAAGQRFLNRRQGQRES